MGLLTFFVLFFVGSCFCSDAGDKLQMVSLDSVAPSRTRIIGGAATTIEKYPFSVQLIRSNSLVCGGSIITSRTVLTAAHCFIDEYGREIPISSFQIRAGTVLNNSGGRLHTISRLVKHPSYNSPVRDNDVAVLLMASAFTLSSTVGVASIPMQGNTLPDNTTVTHIGWGVTSVTSMQTSPVLMEVSVRKINRALCRERYEYLQNTTRQPFPVTNSMICAGLLNVGGADACQGDSGSPLLYGTNVIVGLTSWGQGCADAYYPGVSARVASYSN